MTFYVSCERGWIPDLEFNYDIELPDDFIPKPMDGEVVDFQLMDEETVCRSLHRQDACLPNALDEQTGQEESHRGPVHT